VRFDLICEDGTYYTSVSSEGPPVEYRNRVVVHYLHVKGVLRLPLLGLMMRNFWAKKNGANFDPDW